MVISLTRPRGNNENNCCLVSALPNSLPVLASKKKLLVNL